MPTLQRFAQSIGTYTDVGYREMDEKASVELTSGAGTLNVIVSRKEEKK